MKFYKKIYQCKLCTWSHKYKFLLSAFVFLALLTGIAWLFIKASGGFSWEYPILPEYWSFYGSFIGGFLLIFTLLYQIRVFRKQQIEAKFFELIKYYRDNLLEMKSRNPFYYRDRNGRDVDEEFIYGRRVMKTIFEQYLVGRKLAKQILDGKKQPENESSGFDRIVKAYTAYKWDHVPDKTVWQEQYQISEIAYLITFWGIPKDIDIELSKCLSKIIHEDQVIKLLEIVKSIPALFECGMNAKSLMIMLTGKDNPIKVRSPSGLVTFFGGHQYHLGHYFRHFYQAVKYIDSQPWWLLGGIEKYEYIKTLRAQLSNYEQALLFINSLTELGRKWEYENPSKSELISKYNLIKNLPEYFIPDMKPQYYYPKVDFEWKVPVEI